MLNLMQKNPRPAAKASSKAPKGRSKGKPVPDGEDREGQIAEAAYYLAEQRGFEPGAELEDWFAAEAMVDSGVERLH